MIKFRCEACNKRIGAPDRYAGRDVVCPACGERVPVPSGEPELVPEADRLARDAARIDPAEGGYDTAAGEPGPGAGRTCPSCRQPVGEGAVLCTNCGQPLREGLSRPETVLATEERSGGGRGGRGLAGSAVGLIVAAIVAGVFSLIWVGLVIFTGYEFGIVAWAIGGLVGLTAGVIAKNPSPVFGGLAALVAFCGILGAKLLIATLLFLMAVGVGFLADMVAYSPEGQKVYHAVLEEMIEEGGFDERQREIAETHVAGYFSGEQYVETEPADGDWERHMEAELAVQQAVAARIGTMDEQELLGAVERALQRHPLWIEDQNLYLAVLDGLVAEGALTPELDRHAGSELIPLQGGGYDGEYFQTTSLRDQEARGRELRQIVARRIADMSPEERTAAIDAARQRHPRWIADETLHYAVLTQVVDDGVLTGDAQRVARADVAFNMDHDWDQPGFEELDWERQEELRGEVTAAVNARIGEMSEAERADAIAAAREAHPDWEDPLGIELAEMQHALRQEGVDGSFGSAVRASFHVLDLLWFLLAVTSAFQVAVKQGQ